MCSLVGLSLGEWEGGEEVHRKHRHMHALLLKTRVGSHCRPVGCWGQ
jgi:hypothetical protein